MLSFCSKVFSMISLLILKNRKLVLFGAFRGKHFGDNSGSLYLYCIKYHKEEYRCIWLTDSLDVISYIRGIGGEAYLKKSIAGIWLSLRAAIIVTTHHTNDVLLFNPSLQRPKVLYLYHGCPNRKGHTTSKRSVFSNDPEQLKLRNSITCMIATSVWVSDRQRMLIPVLPSQVSITGYPRTDLLFEPDKSVNNYLQKKYDLGDYTVLYATTWRKWESARYFPLEGFDLNVLSDYLKERNIKIILRPHPADLKRQKNNLLWKSLQEMNDTIKVVTQEELADVQPLLHLSNCLITDYSSVYHDFLLLNRPIIFLPYDINEYEQRIGGFNMDYERFSPGPKPKTQAEFLGCLEMFMNQEDPFLEKRLKIRDIIHDHKDGQSCRRVYELIKEMTTPV
jgi:CDP-glycerol glycerophosphotransferase (TagB/SpsB family)